MITVAPSTEDRRSNTAGSIWSYLVIFFFCILILALFILTVMIISLAFSLTPLLGVTCHAQETPFQLHAFYYILSMQQRYCRSKRCRQCWSPLSPHMVCLPTPRPTKDTTVSPPNDFVGDAWSSDHSWGVLVTQIIDPKALVFLFACHSPSLCFHNSFSQVPALQQQPFEMYMRKSAHFCCTATKSANQPVHLWFATFVPLKARWIPHLNEV